MADDPDEFNVDADAQESNKEKKGKATPGQFLRSLGEATLDISKKAVDKTLDLSKKVVTKTVDLSKKAVSVVGDTVEKVGKSIEKPFEDLVLERRHFLDEVKKVEAQIQADRDRAENKEEVWDDLLITAPPTPKIKEQNKEPDGWDLDNRSFDEENSLDKRILEQMDQEMQELYRSAGEFIEMEQETAALQAYEIILRKANQMGNTMISSFIQQKINDIYK
jgi:hypothetical protein